METNESREVDEGQNEFEALSLVEQLRSEIAFLRSLVEARDCAERELRHLLLLDRQELTEIRQRLEATEQTAIQDGGSASHPVTPPSDTAQQATPQEEARSTNKPLSDPGATATEEDLSVIAQLRAELRQERQLTAHLAEDLAKAQSAQPRPEPAFPPMRRRPRWQFWRRR